MARLTLKAINAAIRQRGVRAELVRGAGYFYYAGPDVDYAYSTSQLVYSLGSCSLEEWVEGAVALAEESARRGPPQPEQAAQPVPLTNPDAVGQWLGSVREYKVPPAFFEDCLSCCCEVGFVVGWAGRNYVVACTADEATELLGRARYYVDPDGPDAGPGLRASAAATVRAMEAQF